MDVWRRMIAAQGGDPDAALPVARHTEDVLAEADGVLTTLDAYAVGVASWRLGAGRARKEDPVQAVAGIELHAKPGDEVRAGQPLLTLHTDTPERFDRAREALAGAVVVTPPAELDGFAHAGAGRRAGPGGRLRLPGLPRRAARLAAAGSPAPRLAGRRRARHAGPHACPAPRLAEHRARPPRPPAAHPPPRRARPGAAAPPDAAALRPAVRSPAGPTAASRPGDHGPVAVSALPVTLGGVPARQTDETTCGSMVLLMLAATGDPVLADWLEHGTLAPDLPAGPVPPEIPPEATGMGALPPVAATAHPTAAARLAAAQHHLKRRTSARALGPAPWPGRLGTPPWTAAREARFPGVRYRSVPLDDASTRAAALLGQRRTGPRSPGCPCRCTPAGTCAAAWRTAVPRHVVLAVPPPAAAAHRGHDDAGRPVLHLYEPAGGRVHEVPVADLLGRTEPHPALGGWTHVVWVVLPEPVQ